MEVSKFRLITKTIIGIVWLNKFFIVNLKDKQLNGNETKKSTNNEKSSNKEETSTEQVELSKSDEDSLLKLMNECDFATTNAEKFIERLQTELVYLDTVRTIT